MQRTALVLQCSDSTALEAVAESFTMIDVDSADTGRRLIVTKDTIRQKDSISGKIQSYYGKTEASNAMVNNIPRAKAASNFHQTLLMLIIGGIPAFSTKSMAPNPTE